MELYTHSLIRLHFVVFKVNDKDVSYKQRTRRKMAVFWDFPLCSLVEVYRRFRGVCSLNRQDDVSSVGQLLRDYKAQHRRR
jgi:hypothetical protein